MANTPIPSPHNTPMMLGVNGVHPHAHLPHAASAPHLPAIVPAANGWNAPGQCTYVPIAPPATSFNETQPQQHHVKRIRDDEHAHLTPMQDEQVSFVPTSDSDGMASPSSGKKQRPSNYRPPRTIDKKSVVAVTGTLVGGLGDQGKTTVRMRRELSGGQLDQFFRDHDAMEDVDMQSAYVRPRSMSF